MNALWSFRENSHKRYSSNHKIQDFYPSFFNNHTKISKQLQDKTLAKYSHVLIYVENAYLNRLYICVYILVANRYNFTQKNYVPDK